MTKVLGKTFASDDERREYFRGELRNKLPELKSIEGFPIGEDEDIIALSDPPFYTACPNPWLNDFIGEWETEKETIPNRVADFHVAEPFASDVKAGKYSPYYRMHPYHTKVPHPAIMRYILHYTQPGDIVFDSFAGTGMTGLAAQLCANPDTETKYLIENEFKESNLKSPVWGERKAILSDLSPIAGFISYVFNVPTDNDKLREEWENILVDVKRDCEWLFETKHSNGETGRISNVFVSEVFSCPECGNEVVFWNEAVDKNNGKIKDNFNCNQCNLILNKKILKTSFTTIYDTSIDSVVRQVKQKPVVINYEYNGKKYQKEPDDYDLELLNKIDQMPLTNWHPSNLIPLGDKTNEPISLGLTHINHLYFKRNLFVLSKFYSLCKEPSSIQALTIIAARITKQYRLTYQSGVWGAGGGPLSGTLYIPSLIKDLNIINMFEQAINKRLLVNNILFKGTPISIQSATNITIKDNSIDYIFLDPPFGSNLNYSELNVLWESWLKSFTNSYKETIESKSQQKGIVQYKVLIIECFKEAFRVLKYGKWMTIEFSNTRADVWNVIQTSLSEAGFIIANVAALDKMKGSFNAQTTPTAVKQDLVISCYKPSLEFEANFKTLTGATGVWEFVREHLEHLPVTIHKTGKSTAVVERSPKILYDRLITFYLMRNMPVPIDAADFQAGLRQKFIERDGMFFDKEQAAEYDETQGAAIEKGEQLRLVFDLIYSESDALLWLQERLKAKPQTYQDIQPDYRKANVATRKGEIPTELLTILEENFIQMPDNKWRVPDLNEAKDREALRNKSLLKEFGDYVPLASGGKKLKEVRVEALRAGFKKCWLDKDFKTMVVVAEKIPNNILLEDEQLLMYYDIAKDRV